jgi:hypothetical protein
MPITTAAYRHHSPFPAKAQLSKTKQPVIVRVHCFKRRAMAQDFLVAQDTFTIASKLRGLPSPVIIHVLIDEKPSNSSPSSVIIDLFIDEKPPNSRPYPVIIHVHIDENPVVNSKNQPDNRPGSVPASNNRPTLVPPSPCIHRQKTKSTTELVPLLLSSMY